VENEGVENHHTVDISDALLRYVESAADALVILRSAQQRWAQSFQKDHGILQSAGLCTGKDMKRINYLDHSEL
jgi:hypothetical protein